MGRSCVIILVMLRKLPTYRRMRRLIAILFLLIILMQLLLMMAGCMTFLTCRSPVTPPLAVVYRITKVLCRLVTLHLALLRNMIIALVIVHAHRLVVLKRLCLMILNGLLLILVCCIRLLLLTAFLWRITLKKDRLTRTLNRWLGCNRVAGTLVLLSIWPLGLL